MKMKIMVIVLVLAIIVPGALMAQGELTLEMLAETVAALTGRVDLIEERVSALESGPDVGYCAPSVKNYHPMTVAGIAEEFPDYAPKSYPDISFVNLNTETGEITVHWQSYKEIVTEHYDSQCQWAGFELTVN